MLIHHLAAIVIGGAIGGIARFWVSGWVTRRFGDSFPWGTLVVNVSGAAAIGLVAALVFDSGGGNVERPMMWAGLAIGVLGSYTTVSAFSLQTLNLLRAGHHGRAAANVVASLLLCLAAAALAYLGVLSLRRVNGA